jgi:hypothetical protein
MKFQLLNPYLEGKQIVSNKKDANLAAEEIWSDVSKQIKNYVPTFYFTIQDMSDKSLHHVKVKETLEDSNVKYSLKFLKDKKYHAHDAHLLKEVGSLKKMSGGKHKHHKYDDSSSSSSSSSSSDDNFTYKLGSKYSSPMMTLNYYPSIYGVKNIMLPSFVGAFTPYVKLNLPVISSNVLITYP